MHSFNKISDQQMRTVLWNMKRTTSKNQIFYSVSSDWRLSLQLRVELFNGSLCILPAQIPVDWDKQLLNHFVMLQLYSQHPEPCQQHDPPGPTIQPLILQCFNFITIQVFEETLHSCWISGSQISLHSLNTVISISFTK